MTETILALVRELRGAICRCGNPKRLRQTLCRTCYAKLPRPMQLALYRLLGEGYEEAYEAAAAFLDADKKKNDDKLARLGRPRLKSPE